MRKNCWNGRVEIAEDAFGENPRLAEALAEMGGENGMPKVQIVADINVVKRTKGLGLLIGKYFKEHGIPLAGGPVVLEGGEQIKADHMESVEKTANALLDANLGPNDCVLALGGGAVLDVAGYAAAQVNGGVRVLLMPTTPAAMMTLPFTDYMAVDGASVKDGLRVKPEVAAALADLKFTKTILDGVWRGGAGEVLRLATVSDATLVKKMDKWAENFRTRDPDTLREVLEAAWTARQKKGGTTFALWAAHRIETLSHYKIPHGYAVELGVCIDAAYAAERGYLKPKEAQLLRDILENCSAMDGLPLARQMLAEPSALLGGIEAWQISERTEGIVMPAGLGKAQVELKPDLEIYAKVMKELAATTTAKERAKAAAAEKAAAEAPAPADPAAPKEAPKAPAAVPQ